jgi:hypothetical protein
LLPLALFMYWCLPLLLQVLISPCLCTRLTLGPFIVSLCVAHILFALFPLVLYLALHFLSCLVLWCSILLYIHQTLSVLRPFCFVSVFHCCVYAYLFLSLLLPWFSFSLRVYGHSWGAFSSGTLVSGSNKACPTEHHNLGRRRACDYPADLWQFYGTNASARPSVFHQVCSSRSTYEVQCMSNKGRL